MLNPAPLKFTRFPIRDKSEHFHLKNVSPCLCQRGHYKIRKCFQHSRGIVVTNLKIISTGGLSQLILPYCEEQIEMNFNLVLEGLLEINKRN